MSSNLKNNIKKCNQRTEVYSRVCGFFRPVTQWNLGKQEEYKQRVEYLAETNHGGKHETVTA